MDDLDAADLKIIPDKLVTGTRGETLIAARAQAMGFLFHPPGQLEGGLDGIISLRDPKTKALTSDLIAVQSKATDGAFKNDDGKTFTFNVNAADLKYWLKLPMPMILVVSRPKTDEAYYVVIQEYFADEKTRASGRVTFNKKRDRFPDDPEVLLDVARRDANRRALAPAALLEGPMTILGLSDALEKAEQATAAGQEKSTPTRWRRATPSPPAASSTSSSAASRRRGARSPRPQGRVGARPRRRGGDHRGKRRESARARRAPDDAERRRSGGPHAARGATSDHSAPRARVRFARGSAAGGDATRTRRLRGGHERRRRGAGTRARERRA